MVADKQEYNRPPAQIVEDANGEPTVHLRASAVNSCVRQLYYAASEFGKSDEVPEDQLLVMEMGKVLEPFVLETMTNRGWTIMDLRELGVCEVEIPTIDEDGSPTVPLFITGIPDAVGEVPGYGKAERFLIEVKTRSANAFRNIVNNGNYMSQHGSVLQAASYYQMLRLKGILGQGSEAVILTLNKETGKINQEWFREDVLHNLFIQEVIPRVQRILTLWDEAVEQSNDDEKPAEPIRELDRNHFICKSCEWRTSCGNVGDDEPIFVPQGQYVNDQELADAVRMWEEEKIKQDSVQVDKAKNDFARQVILQYMQGHGLSKMNVTGATGMFAVTIQESTKIGLNEEKVRYYLTPQQMMDVREVKHGKDYITIRSSRRGRGAPANTEEEEE